LQGLHESFLSVVPSRLQANLLYLERVRIAATAAAARLPTVYGYRNHVEAGGIGVGRGCGLQSSGQGVV
jgi:hypothetical protein